MLWVIRAAVALPLAVMLGASLVVERFHRQAVSDETGARRAPGNPEIDGLMDWEPEDVVGREPQPLLLVLVDRDSVGVDLHRQAGEGASIVHLAHAKERDGLKERPETGANDLIADLSRVLPCEHRLEARGSALREHPGHGRRKDSVGLVDQ
jgi:hypothetical protein